MAKSKTIKNSDLAAMFRIVGECRELGDDPLIWRQHFYGSLAGLIDADLAAGGELFDCIKAPIRTPGAALWGFEHGFDLSGLMLVWEWNQTDPYISLIWKEFHKRLESAPHSRVTTSHQQLLSPQNWDRSPDYQMVMRTLGADAVIHSFHQLPEGGDAFEGICWFRAKGRPDFDEREVELVNLLHQEITRLIGGALARFDEPMPTELPPRVRQVLACVLEGDSDKEVATRLKLSPHTVNHYNKQIFRHFGVTSRPKLLSRWIRRGWTAKAAWNLPLSEPSFLIPYQD